MAFHASRIVIDVGVLLVLGALSLTFVTAEGFRQQSVAGDGLLALFLVLPAFVMTLLPDQSRPLPRGLAWPAVALAAAALAYSVLKYLDAATLAGTLRGSVGAGVRVLVMGAFTVLAGTVLSLARSRVHPPAARPVDAASPEGAPPARAPRPGTQAPRPGGSAGTAAAPGGTRHPSAAPRPAPTRTAPAPASRVPADARPPARVPPRPRPTDPDTQPTLPAQRPVQPWWPDDLEDLFS